MITILCAGIVKVHKIHQFFATAQARARKVKLAQPVEPKYQIFTQLMEGSCQATPASEQ